MSAEKRQFGGLLIEKVLIEKGETEVYRDDKGRPRIRHTVIAEPKTKSGDDAPKRTGRIGVVDSVNDDGTVTVRVDGVDT